MIREDILKNIDSLKAEDLFKYIKQDVVSLEELRETGDLDASKRRAINKLITETQKEENEAWEKAKKGNNHDLREFVKKFPHSKYRHEANENVKVIEDAREVEKSKKMEILNKIKQNPNSYPVFEIKEFLENNIIREDDLIKQCNIPQSVLDNLDNIKAPYLVLGPTPDSIPDGLTEVYFWGNVGSGKTTALAAILHMAEKEGYLDLKPSPGYLYANQLKNIFSDDGVANDFLPGPTPFETTQYLPLTLKRPNERKSRNVALIELSGEIFRIFLSVNAEKPFDSPIHEKTFNSLDTFLKSNNRKIHFFFIDYDRKNGPDKNNLKQSDYLAAASTYFSNNNIFGKSTDAIYLVLTKSDLLTNENGEFIKESERVDYAIKHINENIYNSFVGTLKSICKNHDINGGKLTIEPLSLGKVYFNNICNFEGISALNIVNILMERIKPTKNSFLNFVNR